MSCVAIIPARGGSKRIPRKNIKPFAGKPIIGYSIEAALQSQLFDRVIVSTDDVEIATVAESFGAEVPFLRPAELADDFAGTNAVVKQCLEWLRDHNGPVEHACCLYATAPFVQVKYLREGYERLVASGKSYAFSVTSFPFPVQRAIRINQDGNVEALYPEMIARRSQDLEEAYHDAGQFYWGRAEAFLNDVVTFSPSSVPIVLPRYLVQDIDTPEDWLRAELMFAALQAGEL
jgi:pseudaminic acid cytidylyltransferase